MVRVRVVNQSSTIVILTLSKQRQPLRDYLRSVYVPVAVILLRNLTNIRSWPIIAAGALRAGPDAHPPLNMLKALIFMGVFAMGICSLIFLLRGEQKRKLMDEEKLNESEVGLIRLAT